MSAHLLESLEACIKERDEARAALVKANKSRDFYFSRMGAMEAQLANATPPPMVCVERSKLQEARRLMKYQHMRTTHRAIDILDEMLKEAI